MTNSRQIARVLGPALVALGVTEAINLDAIASASGALVYLNGTAMTVVGIAVVQGHNRWTRDWTVLVTLVGWALLAGGLYRMFAPWGPQAGSGPATYALLAVMAVIGGVLTWRAYRPPTPGSNTPRIDGDEE